MAWIASQWQLTHPANLAALAAHKLTGMRLLNDYADTIAYREIMTFVLDSFAKRTNVKVVGDKTPGYAKKIKILLNAFPSGKMIYNVRDPRAIWWSALKFNMNAESIIEDVLRDEEAIAPYLELPNFLHFRHEDLLTEPHRMMRNIYDFLGVDPGFDFELYNPAQDPYPDRWFIEGSTGKINPERTHTWRDMMSVEDIDRITQLTAPFLKKYGYDY